MELSRIILGGNPFGGWAHCRDLSYVNIATAAFDAGFPARKRKWH